MTADRTVREPARDLPVYAETEVLVVGGGPAGFAAAVSASRAGAEVTLVERYGHLGGLATGGLVIWYFLVNGFTYPGMEEMGERFNIPSMLYPEVSIRSLLPGPLAVFIATILASLYPIWHLRKLRPIEALQTV